MKTKYLDFKLISKRVNKAVNKNHKTYQDVKMYDSRDSVGRLVSKIPMKNIVVNEWFECWEYGIDNREMWWKYLYTLIIK